MEGGAELEPLVDRQRLGPPLAGNADRGQGRVDPRLVVGQLPYDQARVDAALAAVGIAGDRRPQTLSVVTKQM